MARYKRRLLTESLEDRRLLAFTPPIGGEPGHVFAVAQGTINNPGDVVVETLDTSSYTMPRRVAVLGFEVEGSAGLDPDAVQISGPGVLSYFVRPDLSGGNLNSLVKARIGQGAITVTIGGQGGTTGDYSLEVFLPGDDDGDRDVDLPDLRNFPLRLGSSVGDANYAVEVDANLDGTISRIDASPQRLNYRVTVVEPPPAGVPPIANDDDPGGTPAFTVNSGDTLTISNGPGDIVERNDIVGSPAATISSFGGGSLGGNVTDNFAGTTVPTGAGGTLQVNPDGSFTLVTDTSQSGLFSFDYRLDNGIGTSDATVTIGIIDDIAPTLLITSPVAGQDVAIGSTIPFTANANDNIGVAQVEFFVDGTSIFTDFSSPYGTSFTVPSSPMPLPVSATATDVNGNVTTQSFTIDPVDLTPPSVSITAPNDGDNVSMGSTVNFTANASDDVGVTQVEFFVDGTSIFVDNSAPFATSFTAPTSPTPLSLEVIASDAAGNMNSDTIDINLLDDTPPSITLVTPIDGDSVIEGTSVTATATAFDNVAVTAVEFYVNGGLVGTDNSSPFSVPFIAPNTPGPNFVQARALDAAGNFTDSAVHTLNVLPDQPPTVTITAPNNGDNLVQGSTVTFSADATDDLGVTQVEFFVDGSSIFVDNVAPYTTTFTVPASPSPLSLQAVATDTIAQTGSDAISVNIISVTPPTAVDDEAAPNSSPGDDFHAFFNTTLNGSDGSSEDLLGNDTLGSPAAVLTSFGGGDLGGTVTSNSAGSTVSLGGGGLLTVNSNGSFSYTPVSGFTGIFTFDYRITNAGGSSDGTVEIAVGERPEAVDDTVNSGATGNVRISSDLPGVVINTNPGDNLLDNDSGDGLIFTPSASSANFGDITSLGGGHFTYNPPAGFNGTDTFTYQISNGFGSDTGTVSITVQDMIWFIDSGAPGGGDGRLTNPFNSLTGGGSFDALATDAVGDSIFLSQGSYTGGLTLLNNQRFLGEGMSDPLSGATGFTFAPGSDPLPGTNGTDPVISSSGINLAAGNTIRGITIGSTSGAGLSGSTVGSLTVSESTINGNGQAIDIDGGDLTVTFDSLSSSSSAAEGIDINNVTGSFEVTGGTNISSSTDTGIDITSSSATFTFADLDVTTTNDTGINVNGSGTLTSTSGTISTGSGTGIDITSAPLSLTFDSVAVDGANEGINLDSTSGSLQVGTVSIRNIVQSIADTFNSTTGRPTSLGDGNGVTLNNHSGSFTINGGTFTDIADNALDIRNSNNTTLNNVTIQDGGDGNTWSTGNSTIQWYLGNNLTLNTVNISQIGDNTVQGTGGVNIQDSGIKAYDVSGDLDIIDSIFNTATGYVFGNSVNGSEDRAVELDNDTGTDMNVEVTGSTFQNFDFQGLNLRHIGGSLDAIIGGPNAGDRNTFENINGSAIDTGPSAAASSGNVHGLIVENNSISTVGIGVSVFSARGTAIGGVSGSNVFIEDNDIDFTTSDAIRLLGQGSGSLGNPGIFRATVTGNTITNVANQLNNIGGGNAFFVAAEDNADVDVTIDDNTVSGGSAAPMNFAGGITTQNQRDGDLDLILTNNNFSGFTTGAANGFAVGFFGNDSNTVSSNTETSIRFGGNNWNNEIGGFFETLMFDPFGNQMDIEGYAGGPGDGTAINTYLNSLEGNSVFTFGFNPNTTPVTGGAVSVTAPSPVPTTPLMAADGQGAGADVISEAELSAIVNSAVSQLIASGLTASQQALVNNVTVSLVDLTDGMLGQTAGNDQVMIDIDGAGWGWFVDSTPEDSLEFDADGVAVSGSDAEGRVDLLTTVMHELGHVLGLGHGDEGVMDDTLALGTRGDLDEFFASLD